MLFLHGDISKWAEVTGPLMGYIPFIGTVRQNELETGRAVS